MSEKILNINPENPEKDFIDQAVHIINNGGVIAFPTRSLYGLGADAMNPKAVQKIFDIKKRPLDKPILVLIKDKNAISDIAKNIPPSAFRIMDAFWPGHVTIVLEANPVLPEALTAGTGRIGVRIPQHPVAFGLVKKFGKPLTGTSANISGEQGCSKVLDLDLQLKTKLDLILDAGALKKGKGSTIVDVTIHPPKVLREGEMSAKDIDDLFKIS
jgi:L-threonylcarbamoyladenylate synthase